MLLRKEVKNAINNANYNSDASDIYLLLQNKYVVLDMIINPEDYKKVEFVESLWNDPNFVSDEYNKIYDYSFLKSNEFIEMIKQYKAQVKQQHPIMDAYKGLELFISIPNDEVVNTIFCNPEIVSHITERNPIWFTKLVSRLESLDDLLVALYKNNDLKNIKKALEIKSQTGIKQK